MTDADVARELGRLTQALEDLADDVEGSVGAIEAQGKRLRRLETLWATLSGIVLAAALWGVDRIREVLPWGLGG